MTREFEGIATPRVPRGDAMVKDGKGEIHSISRGKEER